MAENKIRNFNRRYTKEYHIFRWWLHLFAMVITYPYFRWSYNLKFEGRENLPKGSHYIITANHISMFDPLMVSTCVFKPIAYMAKKELFDEDCNLNWWIKRLGAFSVNREKPEIGTFKTVKDVLKTNWALGIFPEGHINKTNKIANIQKGFAVIAKKAKCDIVPIAIKGFEGYTKKFHAQNIVLKVGKPISHELSDTEILEQWVNFICKETGLENGMIKNIDEENIVNV
ncbi:1-acyl-sn-glycerol-3-phosphate acyltransferase [bacterium]|nr:1-acyl-sn-glycerol-3-phosphate acyltransferase [bacterium]